jgi:KDO2-lipid IV(A) lauroyltransferase
MPKNSPLKKLKNDLIYLAVRVLVALVRALPRFASLFLARVLAWPAYFLARGERRKMDRNLELALGSTYSQQARARIGRRVFLNIAQNLVDAVLVERLLARDPDRYIEIRGLGHAQKALEQGRGVIFLTAHTGCFEMLPGRFSQLGFPIAVMGARIYDPRLNDLITRNRRLLNVTYLQRDGDLRAMVRHLRAGRAFGVLCDLDTRVESEFITFFGRPAKTPAGPFRLGIKLNVPLIPVFTVRAGRGVQAVTVYPPIEPKGSAPGQRVAHAMNEYNRLLESLIKTDPAQWIWMHERWKYKR